MIGFPFDSHVTYEADGTPVYDRAISSLPYRKLIHKLFSDGILPTDSNNLRVAANNNMTVTVKPGFAIVQGCMKLEEDDRTLAIQAADGAQDRIDTVVLRLDSNDDMRICDLYVLQGVPSNSPVHPALTRTESIWEIGLADLFITKGSSSVTAEKITDTRYDSSRCGVISSVSEFDTTFIYNQVQSDLNGFKLAEQADFLAWVARLQDILDENTAGHLQNEIDALDARVTKNEGDITDLSAEVEATKKSVSDGKALLATSITNKKVPTNPTDTFAQMASNIDSLKLGSGTAQKADVLSGKTFTNSDGVEYTGTMANHTSDIWQAPESDTETIKMKINSIGYYNGSTYVKASKDASFWGNASASDVASGKTFTSSAGLKVSGTKVPSASSYKKANNKGAGTYTISNIETGTYLLAVMSAQGGWSDTSVKSVTASGGTVTEIDNTGGYNGDSAYALYTHLHVYKVVMTSTGTVTIVTTSNGTSGVKQSNYVMTKLS